MARLTFYTLLFLHSYNLHYLVEGEVRRHNSRQSRTPASHDFEAIHNHNPMRQ